MAVKRSRKAWVQFAVAVGIALLIGVVALAMVYGLVSNLIGQQTAIKSNYEKQKQQLEQQVKDLNAKLNEKKPIVAQLQQEVRVKVNIDPGQPITADLLEEVTLPTGQVPEEGILTKISESVGKVSSVPLMAGSVIHQDKLMDTSNMLPLTKGMRAISLLITPASLVGGSVMAGSRVDILATFPDEKLTRTLLENVRVLMVDGDHTLKADEDAKTKTQRRFTTDHMTLELSPTNVERLMLASKVAAIQMALRPYGDTSKSRLPGVDSAQLISGQNTFSQTRSAQSLLAQAKHQKPAEKPVTLQILRGTQSESHAFEVEATP